MTTTPEVGRAYIAVPKGGRRRPLVVHVEGARDFITGPAISATGKPFKAAVLPERYHWTELEWPEPPFTPEVGKLYRITPVPFVEEYLFLVTAIQGDQAIGIRITGTNSVKRGLRKGFGGDEAKDWEEARS